MARIEGFTAHIQLMLHLLQQLKAKVYQLLRSSKQEVGLASQLFTASMTNWLTLLMIL